MFSHVYKCSWLLFFHEKSEVFYVAENDNIISEQCLFFTEKPQSWTNQFHVNKTAPIYFKNRCVTYDDNIGTIENEHKIDLINVSLKYGKFQYK